MPDLSGFVGSPTTGRIIEQFGQDIRDFGATLLGLSRQTQKAMYDGTVVQEVTAAKRLAYERLNEFNYAILNGTNTDYKSYLAAWGDYQTDTLNRMTAKMTTQEARDEASAWWAGASQSNAAWLTERAAGAMVAEAEATAKTTVVELARHGNEAGIVDIVRDNVKRGVWTGAEGSQIAAEYIPQARYNNALNQLDAIGSTDTALEILSNTNADDAFKLPSDGDKSIATLRRYFEEKGASNRERAQRQLVAKAAETYTTTAKKWDAGEITGDELRSALGQVTGTTYETPIKGMLDKWNDLYGRGADVIKEREQTTEFYTLQNSLYAWKRGGRQGDAPWNPDMLLVKFQNTKISEAQMKTLRDDWEKADEPDAVVGFRSRIFGAMMPDGAGKSTNPLLAVKPSEIDASYEKGELTIEQHKSLLDELERARKDYESGLNKTVAATEYEASNVVYDPARLRADKVQWLQNHKRDFSGDDYSKWLGRVDIASGNDWKADIFKSLNTFYDISMQQTTDENTRRKLFLEKYDAQQAMEAYMVANPSDKPGAEAMLHKFNGERAQRDLMEVIKQAGLDRVAATPLRPELQRSRQYEAAREVGLLNPQDFPTEYAEFKANLESGVLEEERNALRAAKVTAQPIGPNVRGDTEYRDATGARYVVIMVNGKETVHRVETRQTTDADGQLKTQMRYVAL